MTRLTGRALGEQGPPDQLFRRAQTLAYWALFVVFARRGNLMGIPFWISWQLVASL